MLRPATPQDEPFLWQMLYHVIYVPPGEPPPPPEVTQRPELAQYVDAWGSPDDLGVVIEVDGRPVGAAWLRRMTGEQPGYGYVDDQTPELSIALLPSYRSRGLGGRLLTELLAEAAHRFPAVSLSVVTENPARRLYARHGFVVVASDERALTMVRHFSGPPELAALRAPTSA